MFFRSTRPFATNRSFVGGIGIERRQPRARPRHGLGRARAVGWSSSVDELQDQVTLPLCTFAGCFSDMFGKASVTVVNRSGRTRLHDPAAY